MVSEDEVPDDRRLTAERRDILAGVLASHASHARQLANVALGENGRQDSERVKLLTSELACADSWSNDTVGNKFSVDLILSLLASHDHMRAAAALVASPVEIGPAISTVVRGATEALSRAWWLIEDTFPQTVFWRLATLQFQDLSLLSVIAPTDSLTTRSGLKPDAKKLTLEISAWATNSGLGAILNKRGRSLADGPNDRVLHMIAAMMDDFASPEDALTEKQQAERQLWMDRYYHDLSGAAHANSAGVAGYLATVEGPEQGHMHHFELVAPPVLLESQVDGVVHASIFVHERVAEFAGLDVSPSSDWGRARNAVLQALKPPS